jgi:hypothetical protein
MNTEFILLNKDWNAEPNAPEENVKVQDNYLSLSFLVNPWAYTGFEEGHRSELRFYGCTKWRLGTVNDEGWYSGNCRFSNIAPAWGEFYEVIGNLLLESCPNDWHRLSNNKENKHFLFYLRDTTFECDADSFEFIE